MALLLFVTVLFCLTSPMQAQQNQCRTAPVGTTSPYCASEAFVTESAAAAGDVKGPASSTAGHVATFADTTGKVIQDGGLPGTVSQVNTGGMATGGPINTTGTVTVTAATKTDQQTGTSAVVAVTPSQQQSHNSAAKAWCFFDGTTGGTHACTQGYNISQVSRSSAGNYTLTFSTAFSSATSYGCAGSISDGAANAIVQGLGAANQTTTQYTFVTVNFTGTAVDRALVMIACFGRQ